MTLPSEGWILWAGTVGFDGPIESRLEAAADAGYERVSLSPLDVARAPSTAVLRATAESLGLQWIIDPLVGWLPASAASRSPLAGFDTTAVLQMADAIGAVSVSAVALTSRPHSIDAMADAFGALCDQAADAGVDVHLEFIPMTVVRDLATAWAVVSRADRPNGGLLLDTWHFFRSTADYSTLETIPGDRVFCVQISDAPSAPVLPLWEDTFRRRLPGDGDLDLERVLGALDETGGLAWIGPEVFSDELVAKGPIEAAKLAKERIEAI